MQELIASLPSTFLGWIGILTVVIVGILGAWGIFDRTMRDRRKDALDGADDIIGVLEKKIQLLEGRVTELENEREIHTTQITELKATNETLTKILHGRDETTMAFQHRVLEATGTAKETNGIVKKMEESVKTMAEAMTRLASAIEKGKV